MVGHSAQPPGNFSLVWTYVESTVTRAKFATWPDHLVVNCFLPTRLRFLQVLALRNLPQGLPEAGHLHELEERRAGRQSG
jgi:hypothetical protein